MTTRVRLRYDDSLRYREHSMSWKWYLHAFLLDVIEAHVACIIMYACLFGFLACIWFCKFIPESYAFARPRGARFAHARTRRRCALSRPPPFDPARLSSWAARAARD
eukprot:6207401-Pleurochrysis_carterae.AAC.2